MIQIPAQNNSKLSLVPRVAPPPPEYALMAAAQMHSEGRLMAQAAPNVKMLDSSNSNKLDEALDEYGAVQLPSDVYGKAGKSSDLISDDTASQLGASRTVQKDGSVILRRKDGPTS